MTNPSGPVARNVSASPYYTPQHTMPPALPPRRRGRHRSARPYLAMLSEPETVGPPAVTEDTAPPAPADDMVELAALCRQLIAQRPDLARPVHDVAGAGL